jgi:hypothetical protein
MAWQGAQLSDDALDALTKGLGWLSLALGAAEVIAPERLDRTIGVGHHETLTRGFGLREIAAGLGILLSRDPTPWVWARVAGDALDLAALAPAAAEPSNPRRAFAIGAFANVAAIAALDVVCALALSRRR